MQADDETGSDARRQGWPDDPEVRARLESFIKDDARGPLLYYGLEGALHHLAGLMYSQGETRLAERSYRLLRELALRELGPDHPNIYSLDASLVTILRERGETAEALSLAEQAAERLAALCGPDHPRTLRSERLVAACRRMAGDPRGAAVVLTRILALVEPVLYTTPQAVELVGTVQVDLAGVLADLGDLAAAERRFRAGITQLEAALGHGQYHALVGRNGLAVVLWRQGRLAEAERLAIRNVESYRLLLPPGNSDSLSANGTLALIRMSSQRPEEALPIFRWLVEARTAVEGPASPGTLAAWNNLAQCLADTGNVTEAIEILGMIVKPLEERYGPTHPMSLMAIHNLAGQLHAAGRVDKAIPMQHDVVARMRSAGSASQLAIGLRALGEMCLSAGDTYEGLSLLEESLRLGVESLGPEHPLPMSVRVSIAWRHFSDPDRPAPVDAARELLGHVLRQRAIGVAGLLAESGVPAPDLERVTTFAAACEIRAGKISAALYAVEQGLSRLALDLFSPDADEAIRVAHDRLRPREAAELQTAFEAEAAARERVAAAEQTLRRRDELALHLQDLRREHAAFETTTQRAAVIDREIDLKQGLLRALPPAEVCADAARRALAEAQGAAADLWRILRRAWPEVRPATPDELEEVLQPGDVLLYCLWLDQLAVTIAASRSATVGLDVTGGAWLGLSDAALRSASAHMAAAATGAVFPTEDALRREVAGLLNTLTGRDVAPKLASAKRIFVVGAGVLHEVPITTLAVWCGFSLLSDRQVSSVPSGTILARGVANREGASPSKSTGFGDISTTRATGPTERGAAPAMRLAALPFSRHEILASQHLLTTAGNCYCACLGAEATVEAFMREAPASRVLHLATHAETGSHRRPLDARLYFSEGGELLTGHDDMADAQAETAGGILRLASLLTRWHGRLAGCELVVLSACESGRAVRANDGPLALPLGFFVAGARCVLATLWKIPDEASALLITRFLESVLGQHRSPRSAAGRHYAPGALIPKPDALAEAQHWLAHLRDRDRNALTNRATSGAGLITPTDGDPSTSTPEDDDDAPSSVGAVEAGPYAAPFYWGAWVLLGQPG